MTKIACVFFALLGSLSATTADVSSNNLPQILDGRGWSTDIFIMNPYPRTVQMVFNFYADDGTPWKLNFVLYGSDEYQDGVFDAQSTLRVSIPANRFVIIETAGSNNQSTAQGWGQINVSAIGDALPVTARLRHILPNQPVVNDATVIPTTADPDSVILWDNSGGQSTGIAIANPFSLLAMVDLAFYDVRGNLVASDKIFLSPMQHMAFSVGDRYPALSKLGTGLLRITTEIPVQGSRPAVAVMGFIFNPTGSFSTVFSTRPAGASN